MCRKWHSGPQRMDVQPQESESLLGRWILQLLCPSCPVGLKPCPFHGQLSGCAGFREFFCVFPCSSQQPCPVCPCVAGSLDACLSCSFCLVGQAGSPSVEEEDSKSVSQLRASLHTIRSACPVAFSVSLQC